MLKGLFSQHARAPKTASDLVAAIIQEYPEFDGQPYTVPTIGHNINTIIFPNSVFKGMPRHNDLLVLEMEYGALEHIQGRVQHVPNITHRGQENVFFGMSRLSGETLMRNSVEQMTVNEQKQIAHSIATFIFEYGRAFTPEEAENIMCCPPLRLQNRAVRMGVLLSNPDITAHFNSNLDTIKNCLQEYLDRVYSKDKPLMYHRDLNGGNILYDPQTKQVTGIIDFGGLGYGPIAETFATMHHCFPQSFVRETFEAYAQLSASDITYRDTILCGLVLSLEYLEYATSAPKNIWNINKHLAEIQLSLDHLSQTIPSAHPISTAKPAKPFTL